jgi:exosortase/archaeosortase family protein
LSLVLYYSGPSRFAMQKDFVVLYLMFMTIVFAVIWELYTIVTGESYYRVTAYSEYYFITTPVVSIVNVFGIDASSHLDLNEHGISNLISYEYHGRTLLLGIGSGCSGLYSLGLFFSAFLAFVLVRYRTVDWRILTALGLGLFVTWVSNILRMVITIIIGSMYGHPALAFVHSYIGIIIFVVFVTIFWTAIVFWLDRGEEPIQKTPVPETAAASE